LKQASHSRCRSKAGKNFFCRRFASSSHGDGANRSGKRPVSTWGGVCLTVRTHTVYPLKYKFAAYLRASSEQKKDSQEYQHRALAGGADGWLGAEPRRQTAWQVYVPSSLVAQPKNLRYQYKAIRGLLEQVESPKEE
jgi:hypothetical protein